jgi:tetratricopeptide (TPR) repeat protein
MRTLWRYFRFTVLAVAFVLLAVYLFAFTPWREKLGWLPTYQSTLDAGDPIVNALYHYRADHALWPEYLDDLAPAYLPTRPAPTWNYLLTNDGPSLATPTSQTRTTIGYDFDARTWRVAGLFDNRTLRPGPAPATLPASDRLAAALAELDRRIAREPDLIDHRQQKAALLRAAQRWADAEQTLKDALAANPAHYWPPLALAALHLPDTPPTTAPATTPAPDFADLAAFTRAHPAFTHTYSLALAHRLAGDTSTAITLLHDALAQPPEVPPDEPPPRADAFFDAAR